MSQILKILIADDEAPARNRLRDLLGDIENISIVAEAKNGKEALDFAAESKPDLMLLDIRMPLMDGLETAQHAQKLEPKPNIIFTTAYDVYAIKAFDLNAIDYLLKPIRLERLQTALDKAHALQPKQIEALRHMGIELAVGVEVDKARLWKTFQRIRTLVRALNNRRGLRRRHERPPEDHWAVRNEAYEQELLGRYYAFKGWNGEGIPTRKTLERLDLGDVADDLERRGILSRNIQPQGMSA